MAEERLALRPAGPADLPGLLALGALAHGETRHGYLAFSADKARARIERVLEKDGRHLWLLAERNRLLLGFVYGAVEELFYAEGKIASLFVLYVRPEARGGRAALLLLGGFRDWAARQGACELTVHVTSAVRMAASDRLFRRLGFAQTGGNYSLRLNANN